MKTALFDLHVSAGARMVPFAGWDMPLLYQGIVEEHQYTRTRASVFDTCHMATFDFKGETAEKDLEGLVTQSVKSIAGGACSYGYLLAEEGGVMDDVICFRFSPTHFWLVVNAGTASADLEWIVPRLSPETKFENLRGKVGKLDIQGPNSKAAMEKALETVLPDLKYFHFTPSFKIGALDCVLSRTGYTGEWGYELFLPTECVCDIWVRLLKAGEVRPAGLGSRDTLRVEMGYPLYGHELTRENQPPITGRPRYVDFSKACIGTDAVKRAWDGPAARVLTGVLLENRMAARAGDQVLVGGANVGIITSGLFSPSMNVAIALALINRESATPGTPVEIPVRGKRLPAVLTSLPLYQNGTARKPA